MFESKKTINKLKWAEEEIRMLRDAVTCVVGVPFVQHGHYRLNSYSIYSKSVLSRLDSLEKDVKYWQKESDKKAEVLEDRLWKLENPPKFDGETVSVVCDKYMGLTKKDKVKLTRPVMQKRCHYKQWTYTVLKDCDIYTEGAEEEMFVLCGK